jgi:hypothetical protein
MMPGARWPRAKAAPRSPPPERFDARSRPGGAERRLDVVVAEDGAGLAKTERAAVAFAAAAFDWLPARLAAASAASAEVPAASSRAHRLGPRLVDGQPAAAELRVVELLDGGAGAVLGGHFDEREAARPARGLIAHEANGSDRSGLGEQPLECLFVSGKREIADVQLLIHVPSSRPQDADARP